MTNNPTDDELRILCARLREPISARVSDPTNRDGREAADAITTLIEYRQQVQDLKEGLHELVGQVEQGRDGFGAWPYANSGSMNAVLNKAKTLTKESRV